jgi:hypothetical protein
MNRLVLSLCVCVLVASRGASADEKPRWLTDYDEARKLARQSEKPLFVVFRCEH